MSHSPGGAGGETLRPGLRVLVVTQYFWPENFRINDLVASLTERGHEVVVLTGQPNYPSGDFHPGYGWSGPSAERHAGAEVLRVPLLPRKKGSIRLALNYLSFVVTGCWGVLFRLGRGRAFDAVFVFQTSPITVGIPAALAAWKYRAPMLFWVLDLWPQSLAAVGAVRSEWVLRRVDTLVRWVYRRCRLVLVSSKTFAPEVQQRGVAAENIRYFPNWGEAGLNAPSPAAGLPRLPDGFLVLYGGNIGAAQDFPAILDAAERLKSRPEIKWVIVGDGRLAQWAKEEVQIRGLGDAVVFLGQHPLSAMAGFFAAASALLLSLRPDPLFSITVPGKLQSYLASGKPVLAMLDGEGARIVDDSEAGISCRAGDSAALAAAVERMADMPVAELEQMGRNGKAYFDMNFARDRVLDHLDAWLAEVTDKTAAPARTK